MKPYNNEPTSALTHAVGAGFSVVGLVLLVAFAVLNGTVWHVVSFSIYGSSLVLLYTASTLYHFVPWPRAKNVFRRLDHAMIYVLIAGTYTPLCLVTLRGGWGWSLFGVVWGLALIGVLLKSIWIDHLPKWISVGLYLLMGWVAVVAFVPIVSTFPPAALGGLLGGGLLYTIGTIFLGLDRVVPRTRWWGMHEVFHLFVIAGSVAHFWMIWNYVLA